MSTRTKDLTALLRAAMRLQPHLRTVRVAGHDAQGRMEVVCEAGAGTLFRSFNRPSSTLRWICREVAECHSVDVDFF